MYKSCEHHQKQHTSFQARNQDFLNEGATMILTS